MDAREQVPSPKLRGLIVEFWVDDGNQIKSNCYEYEEEENRWRNMLWFVAESGITCPKMFWWWCLWHAMLSWSSFLLYKFLALIGNFGMHNTIVFLAGIDCSIFFVKGCLQECFLVQELAWNCSSKRTRSDMHQLLHTSANTPPLFFIHIAATQTDYQNSLCRPCFPMLCSCCLELSEHWHSVL